MRRTGILERVLLAIVVCTLAFAQGATAQREFVKGDERVQLDFKDVELTVVIEAIAKITGRNFIYDDRVRGRVTIVSPSDVSADQAYAVFEAVLKVKGFTAVPGPGGILKIIPVRDAKESSIDTVKDDVRSRNRDYFVTRLVPLLYIDANDITNTIKPLVSKDASMVAYPPTNTIIITDTEANIRRLLSILEAIDVETYKEELAVILVKYAEAATLADQIGEIYGAQVEAGGATTAAARRSQARRRNTAASAPTPAGGSPRDKVRIMTDERTNSLLVLASRGQLDAIRKLVRQLDIPLVGTGRIHVYYLQHADAEELASTLDGLLSGQRNTGTPGRTGAAGGQPQNLRSTVTALAEGITLNADAATNSLVIQASKESYEALVAVIEQLDIPRPQVLVEALILQVNITDNLELGTSLLYESVNNSSQLLIDTAAAGVTSGLAGPIATVVKQGIGRDADGNVLRDANGNVVNGGTDIGGLIHAAANDSNLNVVSSPHILTSDNEEAEIRIGNNIPIITGRTNQATGNTAGLAQSVNVERQDIGVTLRVTPQISEGESVRLKIFQEVTDIDSGLQEGVGSSDQVGVALLNRKVENTVVVKNGETVVVGGLISDQWTKAVNKVPFLGDIPVLGWLFKSSSKKLQKINLLLFLTPHIVRRTEQMEMVTIRKRDEFKESGGKDLEYDESDLENLKKRKRMGKKPVVEELKKHSRRYSSERRDELMDVERELEAQREAERLSDLEATRTVYNLRVELYSDENSAMQELTRLLDAGYEGSLVSGNANGAVFYELHVGPYSELAAANDAAKILHEVYGYTPAISISDAADVDGDPGEPGPEISPDAEARP